MSLFQPSELLKFLESIGHLKPSKRLSQNFLIDGNILRKILLAAHLAPGDVVVEIGPGPGVLTEALLTQGAYVLAIEKDPLFARALTRLQPTGTTLYVFEEDILHVSLSDLLKTHLTPDKKAKVISNLPYHLTSPIFGQILPLSDLIDIVIVMVQKEVADRIVAHQGSNNYSSFSLFTQFYSTPTLLFPVSPHCFYPKPKVTSAVVECKLHPPPPDIDAPAFFAFVKRVFSMRRKMLTTSLKGIVEPQALHQILHALDVNPKARPEELSLDTLLALFRQLTLPAS